MPFKIVVIMVISKIQLLVYFSNNKKTSTNFKLTKIGYIAL